MPSSEPGSNGDRAERAAARKYGLRNVEDPTGFYDAAHANGRKVQVKRALYERESGEPGVFRFWREHLLDLAAAAGSVVVVVENPSNDERPILRVEKIPPAEVLSVVGDGWRESEQESMAGMREARIPWPELVELR